MPLHLGKMLHPRLPAAPQGLETVEGVRRRDVRVPLSGAVWGGSGKRAKDSAPKGP